MKEALVIFCFLLSAFTLAFAQQVLDSDGNPVVVGSKYYVSPLLIGPPYPPGIKLGYTGNPTCPVTVEINFNIRDTEGIPVTFTIPKDANANNEIVEGAPVQIAFTSMPNCAEASVWTLLGNDTPVYVGIPTSDEIYGVGKFSISKSSNYGYTLSYCFPFHIRDVPECRYIGSHYTGSVAPLVATKNDEGTFKFQLKKAESDTRIRTVV